jgi:hypothetical protein
MLLFIIIVIKTLKRRIQKKNAIKKDRGSEEKQESSKIS